jgi:hypothetical protein
MNRLFLIAAVVFVLMSGCSQKKSDVSDKESFSKLKTYIGTIKETSRREVMLQKVSVVCELGDNAE